MMHNMKVIKTSILLLLINFISTLYHRSPSILKMAQCPLMSLRIKAGHTLLMDDDIEAFIIGIDSGVQHANVCAYADEMQLGNALERAA